MAQLEDPDALNHLDATIRHLVIVLIDTGLRATDACTLPFNPVVTDSVGAPCLRFTNAKAGDEQLVPFSDRAAVFDKAVTASTAARPSWRPDTQLYLRYDPGPRLAVTDDTAQTVTQICWSSSRCRDSQDGPCMVLNRPV